LTDLNVTAAVKYKAIFKLSGLYNIQLQKMVFKRVKKVQQK